MTQGRYNIPLVPDMVDHNYAIVDNYTKRYGNTCQGIEMYLNFQDVIKYTGNNQVCQYADKD